MKIYNILFAVACVTYKHVLSAETPVHDSMYSVNITIPRTCMAGYELVNSTCQACVPGMFNPSPGARCMVCANGFWSNASNSTSCVYCGPSERSILPRNDETTCHCMAGFGGVTLSIYDERSYCIACDRGFFSTGALPGDGSVAQREICEKCPLATSTTQNQSKLASDCVPDNPNTEIMASIVPIKPI